jgi:hypothetical protein
MAFAEPLCEGQGLDIRPLTLILGRNSSGKSALLKLVRLAIRAIAETTDPKSSPRVSSPSHLHLPLSIGEVKLASRFLDLVHGRLPKEIGWGLDVAADGALCSYDVALRASDSDGSTLMALEGRDSHEDIKLDLDLEATFAAQRPVYKPYRGTTQHLFDGLAPAGSLPQLRQAARNLDAAISHLGPLRAHIEEVRSRQDRAQLGYHGQGAADLLAQNDDLATRVDEWYREHLGCRLQVKPLGDAFQLWTTTADGTPINLAQAGEGLHQSLPVVVQQLVDRGETDDVLFDLVEQPELHLHDAVHGSLADLFMETARRGRGPVIIETHSEGLLLRVRRRIVEGTFPLKDLALYFVDRDDTGSVVRRIQVNADGELSDWPEGVFLERYHDVMAMQRAIRRRGT